MLLFLLVFDWFAPTQLSFIILHDFAEGRVVQEYVCHVTVENTAVRTPAITTVLLRLEQVT